MTLAKTLAVGMLPFLPGDAIKLAAAAAAARALRPLLAPGAGAAVPGGGRAGS
jgi:biotin transporter BioY